MKKIAISLLCPLIGALLMTSCLGDDEVVLSSDVALLSFGIKDLKTTYTIKKQDGTDSTYTTVMAGNAVRFTIDQASRKVYNSDSIAYRTDVEKVLVNVKADGGVAYVKADGALGSVEDTIDFTRPVTFIVTSYDKKFTRSYEVSINVHQVDPKKTTWKEVGETDFPVLGAQKAFVKDDSLCVIGVDADGAYYHVATALNDGVTWTTTPCIGLEGTGVDALLEDGVFYLKNSEGLYCSENAIEWTAVDEAEVLNLPGAVDMSHAVALFRQPLSTNESIVRSIFVSTPETVSTWARVWTKLSTEPEWIEIGESGNNVYGCPNLNNLSVIQYAGNMYAFGLKSMGESKELSSCYESRDNGITWKVNESALSLPKDLKVPAEKFSTATDGEYVWVMWSNGAVWRGRWNGIN